MWLKTLAYHPIMYDIADVDVHPRTQVEIDHQREIRGGFRLMLEEEPIN
jgi:hypothetical protein